MFGAERTTSTARPWSRRLIMAERRAESTAGRSTGSSSSTSTSTSPPRRASSRREPNSRTRALAPHSRRTTSRIAFTCWELRRILPIIRQPCIPGPTEAKSGDRCMCPRIAQRAALLQQCPPVGGQPSGRSGTSSAPSRRGLASYNPWCPWTCRSRASRRLQRWLGPIAQGLGSYRAESVVMRGLYLPLAIGLR